MSKGSSSFDKLGHSLANLVDTGTGVVKTVANESTEAINNLPSFLWGIIPFILIGTILTILIYYNTCEKEKKIDHKGKIVFYISVWIIAAVISIILWKILFYIYNPGMLGISIVKNIIF
jgi:hypothetical protein